MIGAGHRFPRLGADAGGIVAGELRFRGGSVGHGLLCRRGRGGAILDAMNPPARLADFAFAHAALEKKLHHRAIGGADAEAVLAHIMFAAALRQSP